jgi:hypothetical protein
MSRARCSATTLLYKDTRTKCRRRFRNYRILLQFNSRNGMRLYSSKSRRYTRKFRRSLIGSINASWMNKILYKIGSKQVYLGKRTCRRYLTTTSKR